MRWCFVLLLVAACRTPPLTLDGGTTPPPTPGDMAQRARDLAQPARVDLAQPPPTSCCGEPGNPGNELGVGKYCDQPSDCADQPANACLAAIDPTAHFCTRACTSQSDCGSGATCACAPNSQQCACIPGECVTPPPGC